MKEYLTIAGEAEVTEIEKKSKFIGRAKPVNSVEEAEAYIAEISKKHWDATHNVYAYIVGINSENQKCSDDGEPSGSSGIPTLEAIKNLGLVNVVVVITRYFGGTLLGRGGLVRSYGSAARSCLNKAGIVRYVPFQRADLVVDYSLSGKIQNELIAAGVKIDEISYLADVTFTVDILPDQVEQIYQLAQEITADQFTWTLGDQVYQIVPGK